MDLYLENLYLVKFVVKNLKATQAYPLLFGASIASVFHQHRAAAIHTAAGIWYSCYDPATQDDLLCEENCDDWEDAKLSVVVTFLMHVIDHGGVAI